MKKKKIILGITGNFGCGKTTVAQMFIHLGAWVIDVDKIYHELIRPKGALYKKIISEFGQEILADNKNIDRKKLGNIVFWKKKALKSLSQITHPLIIKKIRAELSRIMKTKKYRVVIIDAPLLIEADLLNIFDAIIVVKTNQKMQIERCVRQRRMKRADIIQRIRNQIPLAKKVSLADYVIDNNGTLQQTKKQVEDIWRKVINSNIK
jgi:dephospho-CoA kinase